MVKDIDTETVSSASTGLGRADMILHHAAKIQKATSNLFKLDETAEKICLKVRKELNFDFAAVQMIDYDEMVINTLCGSGCGNYNGDESWYAIASHSLDGESDLLDIQAVIAQSKPLQIEIISGWDDRFDKWIYDKFAHENVVRAFVPMVVVRDKAGNLQQDVLSSFSWQTETWNDGRNNSRTTMKMILNKASLAEDYVLEVIGTIEAGFHGRRKEITPEVALQLLSIAAREGQKLRKSSLKFVLELIASSAKELVNADTASLHFAFDERRKRYAYEVWIGHRYANIERPRKNGLGEQAIESGKPKFIPNRSLGQGANYLETFNPLAYHSGTKTMAALPLLLEKRGLLRVIPYNDYSSQGVLYVAFNNVYWFNEGEIGWLQLFADRAADAIRYSTQYTLERENARRLSILHKLAQSLAHEPEAPNLLQDLAGSIANILAADIVTIYEYNEDEERFPTAPNIAGRLRVSHQLQQAVKEHDAPYLLLKSGENRYAECSKDDSTFCHASGKSTGNKENFVSREKVVSTAGALLKAFNETVGVMFVNYRRFHAFPAAERNFIETVASTAAIAIRNRRLLKRREQDVVCMTHQILKNFVAVSLSLQSIEDSLSNYSKSEEIISTFGSLKDQVEMANMLSSGIYNSLNHEIGRNINLIEESKLDGPDEVRRIWDMLMYATGREDLSLRSIGHLDFPDICMDRAIFANVMYCLIENAFKYADTDSQLVIEWLRTPDGDGLLKVQSVGRPISTGCKEHIFRKFFRTGYVSGSEYSSSGVGLGLWMARELISSVEGEIRVELDAHNPALSTFIVCIPRKRLKL
jgi:signal transduction histidine kinase